MYNKYKILWPLSLFFITPPERHDALGQGLVANTSLHEQELIVEYSCKGRLTPMLRVAARHVALRCVHIGNSSGHAARRVALRQKSAVSKWIVLFPSHFYVEKQKIKYMTSEIKGKDFGSI